MVATHRSATLGTWVIDSGASHHYCNNLEDFRENSITETNMIIRLGDKNQVKAKKKGVVHLGGMDIEAFFVPEFRISLLSVDQLDVYGYTATLRSGICLITNTKGRKVLSAILEQGLYILSTDRSAHVSEIRSLRTVRHPNMVNLWHQRFAHLNHQNLRRILDPSDKHITDPSDERITDPSDKRSTDSMDKPMMDPSDDPTDEPLMYPSDTCHRTSWKTPELCQTCVHTKHVIRTKHSIGGAQYYIIYIDDCTRYTEIWVDTQAFHIRRFGSDNGSGEYSNPVFLGLLKGKEITFEPSPLYTQHKNGTAKRMIRTRNTKSRSMMWDANVPIKFWPEAMRTACYLHRRSPTSSLSGNRSPYEAPYAYPTSSENREEIRKSIKCLYDA
jgi:hypothetical protein